MASKRRSAWLGTLVGCLHLAHLPVAAQTIEGVLLDRVTDAPIDLGLVTLFTVDGDSVDAVLADQSGRFRVTAPTGGEFLLAASALGYRSTVASSVFVLDEGGTMSLEFRLGPVPVEIPGLNVETQSLLARHHLIANGFVDRARMGFGRFLTPVDISESRAVSTTDLLTRTGRVTTRYRVGGDEVLMRGILGYCTPFIYLDGIRVSPDIPLDAIAPIHILEAVEVYRSAEQAPPQFAVGLTRCGVIVLWTRSG